MPHAEPPNFEPNSRASEVANVALEALPEDELKRAVVLVVLNDNGAATAAHFEEEQQSEVEAARELLAVLMEHALEVASSIGMRLDLITPEAPGGLYGPDQN